MTIYLFERNCKVSVILQDWRFGFLETWFYICKSFFFDDWRVCIVLREIIRIQLSSEIELVSVWLFGRLKR